MRSARVHGNEDGHSGGRLGQHADDARRNHRSRFRRTAAPTSYGPAPPTTRKTGDCHRSERRRTPTPSTSFALRDLFLVFLTREFVDRRVFHDLLPRDLPSLLDDPRQGPILPGRFVLDFLEHVFRKVQGLLAFIRAGHTRASFEDRLHGVKTSAGVWRPNANAARLLTR